MTAFSSPTPPVYSFPFGSIDLVKDILSPQMVVQQLALVIAVVAVVVAHALMSANASFPTHCVDFLLFVPTAPPLGWVVRIGDSDLGVYYIFTNTSVYYSSLFSFRRWIIVPHHYIYSLHDADRANVSRVLRATRYVQPHVVVERWGEEDAPYIKGK